MQRTSAAFACFLIVGSVGLATAEEPAVGARPDVDAAGETPDRQVAEATADETDRFDVYKFTNELREQLAQGEFEEVERRFQSALDQHPEDQILPYFHESFARSLERAGRFEAALPHARAAADVYAKRMTENIRNYQSYSNALGTLTRLANRVGGPELVDRTFADLERQASQLPGENANCRALLVVFRANRWAGAGRQDKARQLLDDESRAAMPDAERAEEESADDDGAAVVRASLLLKGRVNLEQSIGGDSSDLWAQLLDFLGEQATRHPGKKMIVTRFADLSMERARLLAQQDPVAADAVLDRLDSFEGYRPPPGGWPKWDKSKGMFGGYTSDSDRSALRRTHADVEKARVTHELIGQPAMLPNNDGWVNGFGWASAGTSADAEDPVASLRGKVVVLDFFAVWCGPCIATFPHTRKLQEEFGDRGLQVVGVSEYHEYGWDAEAGRGSQQDGITHDEERAAMAQFARHHELNYPIVFDDNRRLFDHYLVNGIPHLVVIDRRGNMRLYRIGSTAIRSADVEEAIRECLDEPVVAVR